MKTVYKIKNKETGLYSMGGVSPYFTKNGKTWSAYGHVTGHLRQFNKMPKIYSNCVVIEYEIKEEEISTTPIEEWKEKPKTTRAKELADIREENNKRVLLQIELDRTEKRLKELKSQIK